MVFTVLACRPHCATLHKLRLGEALAAVVLALRHIVDPAYDAAHHSAIVPADVGDRGLTPVEGRVGVEC